MNRVPHSRILVTALTHPGLTGKNNEDRYAVSAFEIRGRGAPTPVLLAVLADGIGGHRGGEVAAEMAVNLISTSIASGDARYPLPMLEHALQDASDKIYQRALQEVHLQGMGATAVAAWIIGDRLYTANVGDSRVYLIRAGGISQLSSDHTWIQEALDGGLITPDEAQNHPNSHVIRRFLGSPTPPEVDLRLRLEPGETEEQSRENQGLYLVSGDILMLCSDGLTDLVNDAEILETFASSALEDAARRLQELALERGGHDNITIVALQVPPQAPQPAPATRRRWRGCLGLAVAVLLTSLAVMLAFWGYATYLDRRPSPTPGFSAQATTTPLPPIRFLTLTPGD